MSHGRVRATVRIRRRSDGDDAPRRRGLGRREDPNRRRRVRQNRGERRRPGERSRGRDGSTHDAPRGGVRAPARDGSYSHRERRRRSANRGERRARRVASVGEPREDARALVGRKTFGTMAADLARNLRAMVENPASPATWDAASSEIPRFMREVLERHARPAELRSVVDVLRARDVPGLFVDALRRVDGLNRADPTAERNAVECICATAAVLGVVLGDDDEWDGKGDGDGDGGVEVENPREETRGERRSVPGGVSDAVRAERRDARDVRRELAEGLMRADAVGATLWALSALLDRHPASPSPPPVPRSSETRNPEPDLDLEPSGVLWSFLAVVLGALGPDIVPRTIRGEMHRPPRWLTAVEWSPAGVFYAFSAPHVHAESPENRRDRDVAGDILVACLFARIAREPTRDGSYSATVLTDGGHRGDALLRECAGYFLDHLARRAGASAGGNAATGTSTGEQPRFYRWWCGTSAFASAPRWTRRSKSTSWRTTRGRSGPRRAAKGSREAKGSRPSSRLENQDPPTRRRARGIGSRARGRADPGQRRGGPTEGFSSPC